MVKCGVECEFTYEKRPFASITKGKRGVVAKTVENRPKLGVNEMLYH